MNTIVTSLVTGWVCLRSSNRNVILKSPLLEIVGDRLIELGKIRMILFLSLEIVNAKVTVKNVYI